MVNDKTLGIIYVVIGISLIVLFAGNLLIRFLGMFAGLVVLNYGFQLLRASQVKTLFSQAIEDIKRQFNKKQ